MPEVFIKILLVMLVLADISFLMSGIFELLILRRLRIKGRQGEREKALALNMKVKVKKMKKKLAKHKIFITVIYIIAVLLTPLLIETIDMFLPKVFNPAINIMYVAYAVLSIAATVMIMLMWVDAMSSKNKNKILIAVINIVAVLLTPLLIGAIDMFLPKVFNSAINIMYVAYGILSIAATVMTIWMWVDEFAEREYEKMIAQNLKNNKCAGTGER